MEDAHLNEKPERKETRAGGSYKFRLRLPDGTVLAHCPTKKAGVQTATVIFGELRIVRLRSGVWELRREGELKATVG